MVEKENISCYRNMLDKTLSSSELKNEETLKTLVKNQILKSSELENKEYIENVVTKRTKEVSNFLGMLRSTSINNTEELKLNEASFGAWKIKHDTEEFRVMYREGIENSPIHTLLVEGFVDGPVDVCLCISLETALYQKWWPQSSIPNFRVTSSDCLQKIRIGEQISLVRMKVSWPMSAREALIHYFEFDYFQDGLVVVLLNSITDLESIDKNTHGFTRDNIPDPNDVVRIDLVGGFAIQKVSPTRSYFRTIANIDLKLELIPPAFLNFISRQLIGTGFKLYKKEVASVTQGDEDFKKALKDPLYEGVRKALYSENIKHDQSDDTGANMSNLSNNQVTNSEITEITEIKGEIVNSESRCEIEEVKEEKSLIVDNNKKVEIRPEVKKALGTLEKAITMVREHKSDLENEIEKPNVTNEETSLKSDQTLFEKESMSYEPRDSSGSHGSRHREANKSKVTPGSPGVFVQDHVHETTLRSEIVNVNTVGVNEVTPNMKIKKKKKKSRYCCFHRLYRQLMAGT